MIDINILYNRSLIIIIELIIKLYLCEWRYHTTYK